MLNTDQQQTAVGLFLQLWAHEWCDRVPNMWQELTARSSEAATAQQASPGHENIF